MVTRHYPRHYTYLLYARDNNMSCPEGRALAICNRIQNGGWYYNTDGRSGGYFQSGDAGDATHQDMLIKMRSIQLATARKWLLHWKSGGSIKTLRSREEQNQWRRGKK